MDTSATATSYADMVTPGTVLPVVPTNAATANSVPFAINQMLVGGRFTAGLPTNLWQGDIGKVLVFNTILSQADRTAVEAYLAGQWFSSSFLPAASPVQLASGATLDLNGYDQQIDSLSDAPGFTGGVVINSAAGTSATLTLLTTQYQSFSGSIQGSGVGLAVLGNGTQVLAGANNYGGVTSVVAGTLSLAATNAISASAITVSGTGILTTSVPNAISGTASLTVVGSSVVLSSQQLQRRDGGERGHFDGCGQWRLGLGESDAGGRDLGRGRRQRLERHDGHGQLNADGLHGYAGVHGQRDDQHGGYADKQSGLVGAGRADCGLLGHFRFQQQRHSERSGRADQLRDQGDQRGDHDGLQRGSDGGFDHFHVGHAQRQLRAEHRRRDDRQPANWRYADDQPATQCLPAGFDYLRPGRRHGDAGHLGEPQSPAGPQQYLHRGQLRRRRRQGGYHQQQHALPIRERPVTEGNLRGWLNNGYNGGNWGGSGFVTSLSIPATGGSAGIGYLSWADYHAFHPTATTFDGYTPGANDVVAMYTYMGDANLNGVITLRDYQLIDQGYLAGFDGSTNVATWVNGDFNYDGVVNYEDYALIDASVGLTTVLGQEMIAMHTEEFAQPYVQALNADLRRRCRNRRV